MEMDQLRQAAQQALEAWEHINKYGFVLADYEGPMEQAITAIRAALERPEQEPVVLLNTWISETEAVTEPLYKAPRRLTDAEIGEVWFAAKIPGLTETDARRLLRAAEARSGAR